MIGGSGSGKSEYAENLAAACADKNGLKHKYYVAAMKPFGEEALQRIQRHHALRARKGFETIECYTGLEQAARQISERMAGENAGQMPGQPDMRLNRCVVLLECMSNVTANEMFDIGGDARERIIQGIKALEEACACLVVVTNDVFSDGIVYDAQTQAYNRLLGGLNRFLTKTGDLSVEVVYGCPIVLKGELTCLL